MENNAVLIEVGMAQMKISSSPDILVTRGLGSCLGIVIYDPYKKMGALVHTMLPHLEETKIKTNPAKFVDSGISLMVEALQKKGCQINTLVAKLFGGAHMFSSIPLEGPFSVGTQNIKAAKVKLDSYKIKVAAEETMGNYGRTIFLDLKTGKVKVKTAFYGEKEV